MFIRIYNEVSLRKSYSSKFVSISKVDSLYNNNNNNNNNNIIVYDIKMIYYIIR